MFGLKCSTETVGGKIKIPCEDLGTILKRKIFKCGIYYIFHFEALPNEEISHGY